MAAENNNGPSDSYDRAHEKNTSTLDHRLKRNALILKVLQETGITPCELVHLKREDINTHSSSLTIKKSSTKNKTSRNITISPELAHSILTTATTEYLFSNKRKKPLTTRAIRKILHHETITSGKKATSQDLRRNYIRKAISMRPLAVVKKEAGIKRLNRKHVLTKEAFTKLKNAAQNSRETIILDILFSTGCRINELTAIKVRDIGIETAQISFENRTISLTADILKNIQSYIIQHHKHPEDHLFSTRQGPAISSKRVYQIIRAIAQRAEKKAGGRILRNTAILHALSEGKSLDENRYTTGIKNLNRLPLYGFGEGAHE